MQAIVKQSVTTSIVKDSVWSAIGSEALASLRALLVILVLCCGMYPLVVYGLGQVLFSWKANGSLIDKDGNRATPDNAVGSRLLGQNFTSPRYFHLRPSAAGSGYDAANSSGTNLGAISDKFLNGVADDPSTKDVDESFAGVKQLVQAYRDENELAADVLVPADAVTRSASGLDPHISPRNAELQVARVAKARALAADRVRALVDENTDKRDLGIFGEDGVNVTMLNIALDRLSQLSPGQGGVAHQARE
jgi:potassium-transporting ATPase KdpC subunit